MQEKWSRSKASREIDPATRHLAHRLVEETKAGVRSTEQVKRWLRVAVVGLVVLAVIGLGTSQPAGLSLLLLIAAVAAGAKLRTTTVTMTVDAAGVVRIPVADVPAGDVGVQVDLSGLRKPLRLSFATPKDLERLKQLVDRSHLTASTLPPILARLPDREVSVDEGALRIHDLEAELDELTQSLRLCLDDRLTRELELGLVNWLPEDLNDTTEYGAAEIWSELRETDAYTVADQVAELMGEISRDRTRLGDLSQALSRLQGELERAAKRLSDIRDVALVETVPGFQLSVAGAVDLGSFNFYCPSCNRDLAEGNGIARPDTASRLVYEVEHDEWTCLLCGEHTWSPLPVPRMLDELLLPTYEFLLEEHRLARQEVYNRASEAIQAYKNEWEKELEGAFQGNRNDQEDIKARLRELQGRITSARNSLAAFEDMLKDVKALRDQRLDVIQTRYFEASERIAKDNREFLERQGAFIAGLRREHFQEMEGHAQQARVEDQRRHAILESTAQACQETAQRARESAAVDKAMAHEMGLDRAKGPLGWGRNLERSISHFMALRSGKTPVEHQMDRDVTS